MHGIRIKAHLCTRVNEKIAVNHPTKKAKRSAPLMRVTAEEWARQFKNDLYADGRELFCRFCENSTDFTRVDSEGSPQE